MICLKQKKRIYGSRIVVGLREGLLRFPPDLVFLCIYLFPRMYYFSCFKKLTPQFNAIFLMYRITERAATIISLPMQVCGERLFFLFFFVWVKDLWDLILGKSPLAASLLGWCRCCSSSCYSATPWNNIYTIWFFLLPFVFTIPGICWRFDSEGWWRSNSDGWTGVPRYGDGRHRLGLREMNFLKKLIGKIRNYSLRNWVYITICRTSNFTIIFSINCTSPNRND